MQDRIIDKLDHQITSRIKRDVIRFQNLGIPIDDDTSLVILYFAQALFEKERLIIYSRYPDLFHYLHMIIHALDKVTGDVDVSFISNDDEYLDDKYIDDYFLTHNSIKQE